MSRTTRIAGVAAVAVLTVTGAATTAQAQPGQGGVGSGAFRFQPLASSATCTTPGGNPTQPFVLPPGYAQTIVASEPDFPDTPDMNTQNETGPQPGRFLYRPHEMGGNGAVTVTDLQTGATSVLAQRADWERLDGIVWSPWGTIVTAEETSQAAFPDPRVPQAQAGLAYEIDPRTGEEHPLPQFGSRANEGMRFDAQGNLYGITESNPGYIYRYVPDHRGDLSTGQLSVLKVTAPDGDRTGGAEWVPLDRAAVQVNSDAAAKAAGATTYNRPEDVEIATSTGHAHQGAQTMFVSVTGQSGPADNRVLAIDLREPAGGAGHDTAFVYDYIRRGLNAPADFDMPDNLALSKAGDLYVTEDPGGNYPTKTRGDDIWVAQPPQAAGQHQPAANVVRFATLTDCDAEPTGIYFDRSGWRLFVNVQHRGGDTLDKAVAITSGRGSGGNR
jgi:hypothetical protein